MYIISGSMHNTSIFNNRMLPIHFERLRQVGETDQCLMLGDSERLRQVRETDQCLMLGDSGKLFTLIRNPVVKAAI